jgi:hypothetical protein
MEDQMKTDYDAAVDWMERLDRIRAKWWSEFDAGKSTSASWPKMPAALTRKVWLDFGRLSFVKNEKALDKLSDLCLDCIAMLKVSTELAGHECYCGRQAFRELELGDYLSERGWERFVDFVVDEPGSCNWRISDYGLPQVEKIYSEIFRADSPESRLVAIDKVLNVIHQRSDLSALFIEGGSKTLWDISIQV